MSILDRKSKRDKLIAEYDRSMLRAAFVSLFWVIIAYRKSVGKFTFVELAKKIGIDKSAATRWFSSERPNWTVNTISDLAGALGVDITISARDRATGIEFTPQGVITSLVTTQPPIYQRGLNVTTQSGGRVIALHVKGAKDAGSMAMAS